MDDLKFVLKFKLLLIWLDKPKVTHIIHTVLCVFRHTHTAAPVVGTSEFMWFHFKYNQPRNEPVALWHSALLSMSPH